MTRRILALYALGLVAIPVWMLGEVVAGRWDARKVELRRAWELLSRAGWPGGQAGQSEPQEPTQGGW